jgi:hypothetical protein
MAWEKHLRWGARVIAMAIDAFPLLGGDTRRGAKGYAFPCHGTEIAGEENGGGARAAIASCMPQIRVQLRAVALDLCSVGVSIWLQRPVAVDLVSSGWTVGAAPLFHLLLLCLYFVSFGTSTTVPQVFLAGASSNREVLPNPVTVVTFAQVSYGAKLKKSRKTS